MIVKKMNRMKVFPKTAKKFSTGISCSPVKSSLKTIRALVKGQIERNEIQGIYRKQDGQYIQGNIFGNSPLRGS